MNQITLSKLNETLHSLFHVYQQTENLVTWTALYSVTTLLTHRDHVCNERCTLREANILLNILVYSHFKEWDHQTAIKMSDSNPVVWGKLGCLVHPLESTYSYKSIQNFLKRGVEHHPQTMQGFQWGVWSVQVGRQYQRATQQVKEVTAFLSPAHWYHCHWPWQTGGWRRAEPLLPHSRPGLKGAA